MGVRPTTVAVGDVDSDNDPDIVVGTSLFGGDGSTAVLRNDGNGGFDAPAYSPVDGRAQQIALADVNGDGNLDLLAPGAGLASRDVLLLVNPGDGLFIAPRAFYAAADSSIAVGDVDRDGDQDLIVVSGSEVYSVRVLLNSGVAAGFTQHPAATAACPGGLATFAVAAAGGGDLSFQWELQAVDAPGTWVPLEDGDTLDLGLVAGSTTTTLTIENVALEASGARFRCVVTNACGSVASDAALLTVRPLLGDLNDDRIVNFEDLGALLAAYLTCPDDADYNAAADLDPADPCINNSDLGVLLANYLQSCPAP